MTSLNVPFNEKASEEKLYAACLTCGSVDIDFLDERYCTANMGGGQCRACGRRSFGGVSIAATLDEMVSNWNGANDIHKLIIVQQRIIQKAREHIEELRALDQERNKRGI